MSKAFARRLAWGAFYTGLLAIFIGQLAGLILVVLGLVAVFALRDGPGTPLLADVERGAVAEVRDALGRPDGDRLLARDGAMALFLAASRGHAEIVDLLLTRGVPVDAIAPGYSNPALHWAIAAGHLTIAQRLLAAGADPCLRRAAGEDLGGTALRCAVSRHHPEILAAMVATGRVPPAELGQALASEAIANNPSRPIMRILLEAGAPTEEAVKVAAMMKRADLIAFLEQPSTSPAVTAPAAAGAEPPLLSSASGRAPLLDAPDPPLLEKSP